MSLEDRAGTKVPPGQPTTQRYISTSAEVKESCETQGTGAGGNLGRVFCQVLRVCLVFSLPPLLSTDAANGNSFVFNPGEFAPALSPANAHAASCSPPLLPLIDLYGSSCQRKLPEKSKP